MKNTVLELAESVIHDSYIVSEDEAMDLYQSDAPEELFSAAEKIVQSCCTKKAELCSIINAKQGRCPENCRYCALENILHINADDFAGSCGSYGRKGGGRIHYTYFPSYCRTRTFWKRL